MRDGEGTGISMQNNNNKKDCFFKKNVWKLKEKEKANMKKSNCKTSECSSDQEIRMSWGVSNRLPLMCKRPQV